MKKVMAFVKKRWPLIVSLAVILVSLPTAWVVSNNMGRGLKQRQEASAKGLLTRLDALKVNYELPAPVAGLEPIRQSGMPHTRITEWYRQQQTAQGERLAQATAEIVAFNHQDRGVLVEGLFPTEPKDDSEAQLLRLRMQDILIPNNGRSAYEQLLRTVKATTPPDPLSVLEQLNDTRSRLFEREQASGAAQTEPDEMDALKQELTAQRVSLYARPAQENSVYLSLAQFPEGSPFQVAPAFPRQALANTPNLGTTFLWQLDYWLAQDLIGFIGQANARGGQLLPIVEAPIKRVMTIRGQPLRLTRTSSRGQYDDAIDAGPDPASQVIEPRFGTSPSGREADWLNRLYDVRRVDVSLVVDSSRIPWILDAAARQNLITVVGMDILPVDVWGDLEKGFYYGQDHVVQLDLDLELIYLRAWTAPLMPNIIRQELGLEPHPEPRPEDEGMGEDPGIG